MNSVELFTGAGGLALGTARSGFRHLLVVERDKDSCGTLRENKSRGVEHFVDWEIKNQDISTFDFSEIKEEVTLVAGGPPCQPFSLGGKHGGFRDLRNMFPEAVRAVRELRPKAFIFENVKGLLRESFSTYFEYIVLQLKHPCLIRRKNEEWEAHLQRLEKNETKGAQEEFRYNVVFSLLNSADFGVPQRRERVFIIGIRADLQIEWSFPRPTHSLDALIWDQWISGGYWKRHGIRKRAELLGTKKWSGRLAALEAEMFRPETQPWRTVRDAIGDLPNPGSKKNSDILNHILNPGARSYTGHTGSDLDEPAKVLKAGDHGVPGGENMLALPDGSVRYLTVRESARIQTFPDNMYFPSSWTESMRQIGNAVPVTLAQIIANDLRNTLETTASTCQSQAFQRQLPLIP